jgi:hypothetical protein
MELEIKFENVYNPHEETRLIFSVSGVRSLIELENAFMMIRDASRGVIPNEPN